MKRRHFGLIAILLSGVLCAAQNASSAQFEAVSALRPVMPVMPLSLPGRSLPLPLSLPGRPLPLPSAIPGPLIQLPGPTIPIVSVPGGIQVRPYVPVESVKKGFFPAARKMFAAAPGQSVSRQKLDAGFDQGAKASAPVVATSDPAVDVKNERKEEKKDAPKRRPIERSVVIPVPTLELEREIGI